MSIHPAAGTQPAAEDLVNIPALITAYYQKQPHIDNHPSQAVSFGTSGHRGSALNTTFNQHHILAITQAICEYRKQQGITGPVYVGKDTHALSEPAMVSVLEVLAANGVVAMVQTGDGYTPTPVVSHAILTHNQSKNNQADGIIITPSHNPPADGGIKYNPPEGGPADTDITDWVANRANELLIVGAESITRISEQEAREKQLIKDFDYIHHYVAQLGDVIDMEAIQKAGVKIGVDPMGGSGINFWEPIAEQYGLDITLVNREIDPTFRFMPLDKDGKIRMDCSSSYAMTNLLKLQDQFDVAVGNDPDYDRHGIVCPGFGLMNPNAYLAVAIDYLTQHRPHWPSDIGYGKTLVSSSMIDKVVADAGKTLQEMPVGFKWYVEGLYNGTLAFGGEESAGASFLRKDGSVWSTDKDGIILALLAAEIVAVTGKTPAELYKELTEKHGTPYYRRIDAPATAEQKAALKSLAPEAVTAETLAGDPITKVLSHAPGNNKAIGGIKVETQNGWFAARPSGTEEIYKIYLESFVSEEHLNQLETDAKKLVQSAFSNQ